MDWSPKPRVCSQFLANFDDKVCFGQHSCDSSSLSVVDQKDLLSSSVPAALAAGPQLSPLSDYLSDISCTTSAGPALSPSQAGPQRNSSTLHTLLMKKETMRPVPSARSPDSRKTYDRMRLKLVSYSNDYFYKSFQSEIIKLTCLFFPRSRMSVNLDLNVLFGFLLAFSSQSSPLSQSAPTPERCLVERMWSRREPRTHFTSECSVGESSVTDEVNEIIGQMSPINQQVNDIRG